MHGYAVIHPGLEAVVEAELSGLGVSGERCPGGVRFSADPAKIAALARAMRTPSQLLVEVAHGSARSTEALGGLVRQVPWRQWFNPLAEVQVDVSSKGSALRFRENVTRSVFGMIREARKGPFSPDRVGRPKHIQRVQVRIFDDEATISIDAGGDLLHRRGWRTEAGKAPIRENLAACLLALAEWDGTDALMDPFCGSGTILIEGALLAANRSPFVGRGLACDEWQNIGAPVRSGPKSPSKGAPGRPRHGTAKPAPAPLTRSNVPIVGTDHHAPTLVAAEANARRAGVSIQFRRAEIEDIEPCAVVGTIVSNLPYGERLGDRVGEVYTNFGRVLRERFQSWRVVFLTTDRSLAERVDKRAERLTQFKNGGIGVAAWSFLP